MWCDKFQCTLSTNACIKRQLIKIEGAKKTEFGLSFEICSECLQGKAVKENPECFINRDIKKLKTEHQNLLNNTINKESKNGKRKSPRSKRK